MKLILNIKPVRIITGRTKDAVVKEFQSMAPFKTFSSKGDYYRSSFNNYDNMYVYSCQKYRKKVKQIREENSFGRVEYTNSVMLTKPHWELRVYKFSCELPIRLEQYSRTFSLIPDKQYQ